jgi:hypothetical protein
VTVIERAIEASLTITRAEAGRLRAWEALRKMRRRPKSFKAVRDYVAASTMVEEAELALLRIKKGPRHE